MFEGKEMGVENEGSVVEGKEWTVGVDGWRIPNLIYRLFIDNWQDIWLRAMQYMSTVITMINLSYLF